MQMLRNCGVVLVTLALTVGCDPEHPEHPKTGPAADDLVRFHARSEGPVVTDRASTGGVSLVDCRRRRGSGPFCHKRL